MRTTIRIECENPADCRMHIDSAIEDIRIMDGVRSVEIEHPTKDESQFRFVLERNGLPAEAERPELAKSLNERQIVSELCAKAFVRIWKSFRNDVHHMNPKVAALPFPELAKRNADDLAIIEREIFACHINNGKLLPVQPRYWDVQPDGTVPVFLRFDP